jgi:hypothetical protein
VINFPSKQTKEKHVWNNVAVVVLFKMSYDILDENRQRGDKAEILLCFSTSVSVSQNNNSSTYLPPPPTKKTRSFLRIFVWSSISLETLHTRITLILSNRKNIFKSQSQSTKKFPCHFLSILRIKKLFLGRSTRSWFLWNYFCLLFFRDFFQWIWLGKK